MVDSFVSAKNSREWRQFLLRWVVLLLAASLFYAGPAEAQKEKKKKKGKAVAEESSDKPLIPIPDDRAIDIAISEMLGAWQIGDLERLHRYYADDVVVVSGAWESPVRGWDNYVKSYQTQRSRTQNVVLDRINTFIRVAGNTGWASYQWQFKGLVDGTSMPLKGHTTLVLEKQKDRWVIVHNHTSLAEEPSGAQPLNAPAPGQQKPSARP